MRIINRILAVSLSIGPMWVSAQSIPVQPLCERYAGVPFYKQNGQPKGYSCDEITSWARSMQLKETTYANLHETVRRFATVNFFTVDRSQLVRGLQCEESLQAIPPRIRCSAYSIGTPFHSEFQLNTLGFLDVLIGEVEDFRPGLAPLLESAQSKQGWDEVFPAYADFLLDLLIAKNNALAPINEVYTRVGNGMRIRVTNIYQTQLVRPAQ